MVKKEKSNSKKACPEKAGAVSKVRLDDKGETRRSQKKLQQLD
jgi:hypothetical protein